MEKIIAAKQNALNEARAANDEARTARLEAELKSNRRELEEVVKQGYLNNQYAEEASEVRGQQLNATREDKTRPSQNAGVQPTTR